MLRCRLCDFESHDPDNVVWHFSRNHGTEWKAINCWIRAVMGEIWTFDYEEAA